MLLKDKVALVTGAGRGIGKAISLRFAEEGASLILCARTASQLQEVTDAIRCVGRPCLSSVVDVAKEDEVKCLVKDGLGKFGQIDILVNNAGISNPKPFLETSLSDWDEALTVNLKGIVLCTRAVLPHMLQRGMGRVINIASAAGLRGLPLFVFGKQAAGSICRSNLSPGSRPGVWEGTHLRGRPLYRAPPIPPHALWACRPDPQISFTPRTIRCPPALIH